jgi:site-specific DNA recombinase
MTLRDEVLIDVEDVAAGPQTKLRWSDRSDWIWSTDVTHKSLVSADDFDAVQARWRQGPTDRTRPGGTGSSGPTRSAGW